MPPFSQRLFALKVLGIVAGSLLVLLGSLWFWVSSTIDRRWADLQRRVHDLHTEAKNRHATRSVLRGDPLPGNAWEDYRLALKDLEASLPAIREMARRLNGGQPVDPSSIDAFFKDYGPRLDQLRQGARRASGQYPFDWEHAAPSVEGPRVYPLVELGTCASTLLVRSGRASEGVNLLLDLCQFVRDGSANGNSSILRVTIADTLTDRIREILAARALSTEELGRVSRELAVLEREWPSPGIAYRNDAMEWGFFVLGDDAARIYEEKYRDWGSAVVMENSWKHFFSWRLRVSNEWNNKMAEAIADGQRSDGPWQPFVALQEEYRKGMRSVVLAFEPTPLSVERDVRKTRAHLRLLRVAAEYQASGKVLPLEDPFGTTLQSRIEGRSLKVWSVGPNGTDDHGDGDWSSFQSKDIVLELQR